VGFASDTSYVIIGTNMDTSQLVASSSVSWLDVGLSNSADSLVVDYAENPLARSRSGRIIVSGLGLLDTLYVEQVANPILVLSVDSLFLGSLSGSSFVDVNTNMDTSQLSVSSSVTWLDIGLSASADSLVVNYQENTNTMVRLGEIIISGGGLSDTMIVVQAAGSRDSTINNYFWWRAFCNGDRCSGSW
jgi:hypothetical protein